MILVLWWRDIDTSSNEPLKFMEKFRVSRGASQHRLATFFFVVVAILAAGSSMAQTVTVGDSRPAKAMHLSARAAADRPLTVRISFQLRNRDALAALLSDLQNPASPQYHQWLTPAQFNARFGRTKTEVQAVSRWLSGRGFRVLHSSSSEITAVTSVAGAQASFATTIGTSADGATFSNASAPQIPRASPASSGR